MSYETGSEVKARVRFHVEALVGSALPDGHPRKPATYRWEYVGGASSRAEAYVTAARLARKYHPGRYRIRDKETDETLNFRGDGEWLYVHGTPGRNGEDDLSELGIALTLEECGGATKAEERGDRAEANAEWHAETDEG